MDESQEIKIDFYRSETSGDHKHLGASYTSLQGMKEGNRKLTFKGNSVDIVSFEMKRATNFLEYVFGGCNINLSIAIDFTLSNGDPKAANSLHCNNPHSNEYLQALRAVGDILQYYDSDKEIPVYGFGASIDPVKNRASHCFALNGDIFAPECNGLDGVVEAYQHALRRVNLYGPTHFSKIIAEANDRC